MEYEKRVTGSSLQHHIHYTRRGPNGSDGWMCGRTQGYAKNLDCVAENVASRKKEVFQPTI